MELQIIECHFGFIIVHKRPKYDFLSIIRSDGHILLYAYKKC